MPKKCAEGCREEGEVESHPIGPKEDQHDEGDEDRTDEDQGTQGPEDRDGYAGFNGSPTRLILDLEGECLYIASRIGDLLRLLCPVVFSRNLQYIDGLLFFWEKNILSIIILILLKNFFIVPVYLLFIFF